MTEDSFPVATTVLLWVAVALAFGPGVMVLVVCSLPGWRGSQVFQGVARLVYIGGVGCGVALVGAGAAAAASWAWWNWLGLVVCGVMTAAAGVHCLRGAS
jgi:hypothetical protein